ncbi:MAG: hypothetical protein KDH09_17070 [Chrysiogenetes bacterium]|nr:hypothetical protein [Chrysiogenetes bacterium]
MKKLSATLFTAALLAACGGGSGSATGVDVVSGVRIQATSSAAATASAKATDPVPAGLAMADQDGTVFVMDTARASVKDVEIELPEGMECEDSEDDIASELLTCESVDDSFAIKGPFVLDLIAGTSTPDISAVGLPSGTYSHVAVKFEEAEVEDGLVPAEDPLAGHTIYLSGTFKFDPNDAGETEKTFEMLLKFSEEAEFANVAGATIDSLAADDLILSLDVASWFSALPITSCITNGDLQVVDNHLMISDATGDCQNLEDTLKEAIKGSAELDDDHHDEGSDDGSDDGNEDEGADN